MRADEYTHGRALLTAKLETVRPEFVIFTFKETAKKLFGRFAGNGFMPDLRLAYSEVFVMPGPYEDRETAAATMRTLAARFHRS